MVAELCDREHKGRALLAYAEARALLASELRPLGRAPEAVPLTSAAGRILATAIALDRDEPPVPRSAMDGFALRSADGRAPRRLVGSIFAGTAEAPEIGPGEAVAVMTGGTVPPGADAVIPVERTHLHGATLEVLDAPVARQHMRQAGEMGRAGRVVLAAGVRLGAGELGIAAASGADPLCVRARPRVAVLATGDEIVPWTALPRPHQVRDSNRIAAVARCTALGAEVVRHGHAPDAPDALHAALAVALADCDVAITIGGVSMGQKDFLPGVLATLGVREVLHGVGIQPGKPVWIGRRGDAWVLGLPGNPVSSFVILELFGRPLLDALHGAPPAPDPYALCPGVAAAAARSRARELWLPAQIRRRVAGAPEIAALPWTGSGDWTCLAGADALLHLPPDTQVAPGDPIRYLPL